MRRTLARLLKRLTAALLILTAAAILCGYAVARRAWPQTNGTLVLDGLSGPVEVRRDGAGVPQIFAQSEEDVFFGQGFVHAQDRLWQMQLARTVARGELSQLFGQAGFEADRATRTMGFVAAAEKDLARLEPETRRVVDAYCRGVNAYLRLGQPRPVELLTLGVEPKPWEPLDVMLVGESISFAMSLNAFYEVTRVRLAAKLGERARELIPPYPDDGPIAVPRPTMLGGAAAPPSDSARSINPFALAARGVPGGSNSWVVHGSRTVTGRPLLANDTHLGLPLPSIWYENGLWAGRYQVVGFSFPGAPLVAIGHNEKVAWGVTNLCSDVQDLYLEKLDRPTDPTRFELDGVWHPLDVRVEQVAVKDAPPVALTIRSTGHGPLVNEVLFKGGELPPVSMRWAAREGGTLFNALAALDRAQSASELRAALRAWDSPSLNFVFADVEGNIGYQATGRIPMRAAGHSGSAPAEGWVSASEWRGFIPYDELPAVTNPPEGFIVSANNKVVPDNYPHFIAADWGDPYRAQRITQVLAETPKVSRADMEALQADTLSLPAQGLLPALLAVTPTTAREREAQGLVRGWDARFAPSSAAATVYYVWYKHLLDDIIGDELGEPLLSDFRSVAMTQTPLFVRMMKSGDASWLDDVRTSEREDREAIAARALTQAVGWLSEHLGEDPQEWRWGRLHTVSFVHQPFGAAGLAPLEWLFNSRTVESPGEPYSVNATFHDPAKPYAVASGPSQRFIVDLADLTQSVSAAPIGQSGLLFHAHREDQVEPFSRGAYHPMPTGRAPPSGDRLFLTPAAPHAALTQESP